MATKDAVLQALSGETVPLTMSQIATKMGIKPNEINTILNRLTEKSLVSKDESNCYIITPEGERELNPTTLESENLTPQKIFEGYGKTIGIIATQLPLISAYVFDGGDAMKDLGWVKKGLGDMGVPPDKANIWWNKWRVYLKLPVPADIVEDNPQSSLEAARKQLQKESDKKETVMIDWDINPQDDLPMRVGEELGRMTHGEAVQMSILRLQAKARAAAAPAPAVAPVTPVDPIAQLNTILTMVKDHFIQGTSGAKPMVILPQDDGSLSMQEFDPSKPMLIGGRNQAPPPVAPITWVVGPDGSARQLQPGEPLVIQPHQAAPNSQPAAKTYVVHDSDGSMEEVIPGKPIILRTAPAPAAPPVAAGGPMMINAQSPDGKPFTIDIDSYFRLEDHRDETRRKDESHKAKMDLVAGLKDIVQKGVAALGNMGEGEDEEGATGDIQEGQE